VGLVPLAIPVAVRDDVNGSSHEPDGTGAGHRTSGEWSFVFSDDALDHAQLSAGMDGQLGNARFGSILWRAPGHPGCEVPVKKLLGIFALLGAMVGAVMFWRKQQDDDEFLDEELE